jgi:hypothetical protein
VKLLARAQKKPETSPAERRAFRRVQAPIAVRPVRFFEQLLARPVQDVSRGGLRAYSDERHHVGERVELELFLPIGPPLKLVAEVVWIEKLPEGSPARFDVGMRYVELGYEAFLRLSEFLPDEDPEP